MPVAVHLYLLNEGKILLLRRHNTGYQDGNYSTVAGHLEGGEDLKAAMIREAREETGIEILPTDLEVAGVMHSMTDKEYVCFFLKAETWAGEVKNTEPDQCDDLRWFEIDNLPNNVVPYVKRAIENFRAGKWFDSFGWTSTVECRHNLPRVKC